MWEYYEPRVRKVMEAHFPDAPLKPVQDMVRLICDEAQTAKSFELLERGNRSPKQDAAALEAAAKHLRQAAKKLRAVGWQGSAALQDLVEMLSAERHPRRVVNPRLSGPLFVAMEVDQIGDRLEAAAMQTGQAVAQPVLGLPIKDHVRGQPEKRAHRQTARRCREAFEVLTGTKATVRVSEHPHKAYGPFYSFVADVLEALEIDASAEVAAKSALEEHNPPKP